MAVAEDKTRFSVVIQTKVVEEVRRQAKILKSRGFNVSINLLVDMILEKGLKENAAKHDLNEEVPPLKKFPGL